MRLEVGESHQTLFPNRLHVTMAVYDTFNNPVDIGQKACVIAKVNTENHVIWESVIFSVKGHGVVHLTGYFEPHGSNAQQLPERHKGG
ncbi:Hypothetical predicted protein [Cloeon dipterum]|uniref:Uncharacterized protein n=1 Tax=Cloeon dipterum TaxID=197152 RepID=A0A8S1BVA6_9INSE|nr:Hypothetical predicted protein [Cloeon dipterum]